jgi:aspartokinase
MLKVADIVKQLLFSSEPELTAMSRGVLNLSAYAKRIQADVERLAMKPVQMGTIVVALSRLASTLDNEDPLLPRVTLESIAVKSNLAEITFNKTSSNKLRAQKLYADKEFAQADFLTITHGIGEISIFAPMQMTQSIRKHFKPEKPKLFLENLAALTVQFGDHYIDTPNMYFALLRALSVRKINIVELVSTFTELTFLVQQSDLNDIFSIMNSLMREANTKKVLPS